MGLCVNCKEYKKKCIIRVGSGQAIRHCQHVCKEAAKAADVVDNVTGKRYVPVSAIDSILCETLNGAGTCTNYDEKGGSLETPEDDLEIVNED